MIASTGFWSYVRADDNSELGRISRLARDVVAQYEMISGESIDLFLDTDSIPLGENWREKIQENLTSAVFFIPVITPRFFRSSACIAELREFSQMAKRLGVDELIISLIYMDVPELSEENSENEYVKLINSFQQKDWRQIRFLDVDSEGYRRSVFELAQRLHEVNEQMEKISIDEEMQIDEIAIDIDDEAPGIIEILAKYEEQIKLLPKTLEQITADIELIGQIMRESTENIQRADGQGNSFALRLANFRMVADRMREPTDTIWANCNLYSSQIQDVDQGIRVIIEQAKTEIQNKPESKVVICQYFNSIREMTVASLGSLDNVKGMIAALEPLEKLSRDIRPTSRKLRQGLTILIDSTGICKYWVDLIENAGINCEGMESTTD